MIRQLVSHFADPTVGAVSGELMLSVDGAGTSMGRGTSFYWRYEKFIRLHESRAASTVGATGAIYAIRRSLFEPIPNDTILDDVLIPLRIVRKGYRRCSSSRRRARSRPCRPPRSRSVSESAEPSPARSSCSRVSGGCSIPGRTHSGSKPFRTRAFASLLPVLHATLFAASMALADGVLYLAAFVAQVGFYTAAVTGHVFQTCARRPAVVTVPYAMCLMLWATVAGFARFITDRQQVTWEQSAHIVVPTPSSPAR